METATRESILKYVAERFGTDPEYPWAKFPRGAVLRRSDNRKWYGLVIDVRRDRLGLTGEELVDVLDFKCDPRMLGSVRAQAGFLPAYHMNKDKWVSVLLDGSVPLDAVTPLLELSYDLAGAAGAKRRTRGGEPE